MIILGSLESAYIVDFLFLCRCCDAPRFLCSAEHWTIFSCFFCYLGCICSMHVLCVSNPALAAKSNKALLLFNFFAGSYG